MNLEACKYLAEAIINGIEKKGSAPIAIGFGGGHYYPKFSNMAQEYAFGHIAAKYTFPHLNEELIKQMIT